MLLTDPLGDMLTRIRNAQRIRRTSVISPCSMLRMNVLNVLKSEGYIREYYSYESQPGMKEIKIELKYFEEQPVIQKIQRVSKPGRRMYSKIKELPRVKNGLGISILSTPQGVMSDQEARVANVGGEVLCAVF
jgi:small subunit ribosomal protein S8